VAEGNPLGALLAQQGLLSRERLDEALAEQADSGEPLPRILIDRGFVNEVDLVRTLATQVGLDFVDLSEVSVDASVATMVPEALARKYQALPIYWQDERLVVAIADPSNVLAVDDIRALTGADVRMVVATQGQLAE